MSVFIKLFECKILHDSVLRLIIKFLFNLSLDKKYFLMEMDASFVIPGMEDIYQFTLEIV